MPKWEVCRIEGRVGPRKKMGIFGSSYVTQRKWNAIADLPQGAKTIDESNQISYIDYPDNNGSRIDRQREVWFGERSKLVGKLLADGWEPLDSSGLSFKRQVQ